MKIARAINVLPKRRSNSKSAGRPQFGQRKEAGLTGLWQSQQDVSAMAVNLLSDLQLSDD